MAGTAARWIVVVGALLVLRGDVAYSQRSLTSVLLPTDTTGSRKSLTPKSAPVASLTRTTTATKASATAIKVGAPAPKILGVPVEAPASPALVVASVGSDSTTTAPSPSSLFNTVPVIAASADASATVVASHAKPNVIANSFARTQLTNQRVLEARTTKRMELKQIFRERGIAYPAADIFMRVFKREHVLEMWVRPTGQDTYQLLKTYDVCALSDKPGPKRVKGDLQTPEGFYYIDDFNPQSDYHLSLRVNYPNESDRILGADHTLGGDIFIHGGCKTAGCMAVTDDHIKEIYWLAVEARDNGQTRIPVHIFPARLTTDAVTQLARYFEKQPDLVRFWSNIKPGFDYFEQNHKLPAFTVNTRGRYQYDSTDKSGLLGQPALADTAAHQ